MPLYNPIVVNSAGITDGSIVNADINASAAIALSKLATDPLARANHTGTQAAATISDFDTQVRTNRLDQMAAPTAAVSFNGQKITVAEAEIDGDLNHDGTNVGFYGVAPVARPSAYTQTYATADKTHANAAQTAVSTTGASNVTPWGYTTQAQANDIVTQLNNARTDILDLKQLVNSVIDDLQALGLAQ